MRMRRDKDQAGEEYKETRREKWEPIISIRSKRTRVWDSNSRRREKQHCIIIMIDSMIGMMMLISHIHHAGRQCTSRSSTVIILFS